MGKSKAPPFVMMTKELLRDPEWRKLSNASKVAYLYLKNSYHPERLGDLKLSYEAMKDVMAKATLARAFKELEETGFIKKHKIGGMYGGVTTYRLNGKHGVFYQRKRKRVY